LTIIALPQPSAEDGPTAQVRATESGAARSPSDTDVLERIASREPVPLRDEVGLVRRLHAGDPEALTEIAQWLWAPLAAYAYRIVEDREAATDIAQEACMRLWERRGRESPRCLRAYLFRMTRNLAFDLLKTKRTRRRLLRLYQPSRHGPAAPDEVLHRGRIAAAVQEAVQSLPERRREVFTLAYLQGLSYAEVGDVLGISPKTVQNQMSAALAHLRITLRPLLDGAAGASRPPDAGRPDGRDDGFGRLV
jgi:RNA polymerase sigma-70 factor, ECF subfamily